MIKNVVFDMGNVLVTYDPTYFLKDYPKEEKALFLKEIYLSEAWKMLDRGELGEEELIRLVCAESMRGITPTHESSSDGMTCLRRSTGWSSSSGS